jgi:hypothetical protein
MRWKALLSQHGYLVVDHSGLDDGLKILFQKIGVQGPHRTGTFGRQGWEMFQTAGKRWQRKDLPERQRLVWEDTRQSIAYSLGVEWRDGTAISFLKQTRASTG